MVLAKLKSLLIKDPNVVIHKPNPDNGKIYLPNTKVISATYPIQKEVYGSMKAFTALHQVVERIDPETNESKFYARKKTTKGWVEESMPIDFGEDTTPSLGSDM